MKTTSFDSDIHSSQKRQLKSTYDENPQKRFHGVDAQDFFGLPHKVKHMFKKHKQITQLYGLFFIYFYLKLFIDIYIKPYNSNFM